MWPRTSRPGNNRKAGAGGSLRYWAALLVLLHTAGCHLLLGNTNPAAVDAGGNDAPVVGDLGMGEDPMPPPDVGSDAIAAIVKPPKLTSQACNAGDWCWVNAAPQGASLRGVWGDDKIVFTVGLFGTILGCSREASNCVVADDFRRMASPTSQNLLAVAAIDRNFALAVGAGEVVRLDGVTWTRVTAPSTPSVVDYELRAIVAVDKNELYILGQAPLDNDTAFPPQKSQVWRYDSIADSFTALAMTGIDPDLRLFTLARKPSGGLFVAGALGSAFQFESGQWTPFGSVPTSSSIKTVAVRGDEVYVGTQDGDIFWSKLTSANWMALETAGIANRAVNGLVFASTSELRAYGSDGLAHFANVDQPTVQWMAIESGNPLQDELAYRAAFNASGTVFAVGAGGLLTRDDKMTSLNQGTQTFLRISQLAVRDNPAGVVEVFGSGFGAALSFGAVGQALTNAPTTAVWADSDFVVWGLRSCHVHVLGGGSSIDVPLTPGPCSPGNEVLALGGTSTPMAAVAVTGVPGVHTIKFMGPSEADLKQPWGQLAIPTLDSASRVTNLYQDPNGEWWLALDARLTSDDPVRHLVGNAWQPLADPAPPMTVISAIRATGPSTMAAVGWAHGLEEAVYGTYDGTQWTWLVGGQIPVEESDRQREAWVDLFVQADGTMIAATTNAVLQWNVQLARWDTLIREVPEPHTLQVDSRGTIWVGGANGAVFKREAP